MRPELQDDEWKLVYSGMNLVSNRTNSGKKYGCGKMEACLSQKVSDKILRFPYSLKIPRAFEAD